MSEADEMPAKAVADPETYRESLDAWMKTQMTDAKNLRVHDVDMPRATGFSNETVFFHTTATEREEVGCAHRTARRRPVSGADARMWNLLRSATSDHDGDP